MSPFPVQELLFQGSQAVVFCAAWMTLLWLLHFPLKNAAIVDLGWPLGIAASSLIYAWYGNGLLERRWLIASMVLIWAIRLSGHLLFSRLVGKAEEGRYQELRKSWAPGVWWKFFVFFQVQALSCVVLSLPMFLACGNGQEGLSWVEKTAAALWVIALSGEAIADSQLARFKGASANQGKVCREGLWGWSRHPNYFFEWLVWVSYAIYALPAPWGFLGLLSPALIYHFVNNVTGIPPTEAQALRSKGEEYSGYQRDVSAFWLVPPKS